MTSDKSLFDKIINYLPEKAKSVEVSNDDEFYKSFFKHLGIHEKTLFGISFKSGAKLLFIIGFFTTIYSLFLILIGDSDIEILKSLIIFVISGTFSFYIFLAILKENYNYAKVSYLIIEWVFFFDLLIHMIKMLLNLVLFFMPFSGNFLSLYIFIYFLGHCIYLLIFFYFIFILERYLLQIKTK